MRIICVDPGPRTGLARWSNDPKDEQELWSAVFDDVQAWAVLTQNIEHFDHVVFESFQIAGPRAKEANQTIETIGVVKYLCLKSDTPWDSQTPTEGREFDPKWEKLKRIGWYVPSGEDHANSAARHLLLFTVTAQLVDFRRVLG